LAASGNNDDERECETYRPKRLVANGREFTVYRHQSLTASDVIAALLNHYSPAAGRDADRKDADRKEVLDETEVEQHRPRPERIAGGEALIDVAEDVRRSPSAESSVREQKLPGRSAEAEASFLRFEELMKRCAHPKWNLDPRMSVFLGTENGRIGSERFRTLRSRLYQIAGTRTLKRIVITSSVPGEGKTFVAANLAQSFVRQPDRRVLLIDADLRASRLHTALGAPGKPGLSDYLRGEKDEYGVIQSGLEGNLCFIPGGNEVSNPSELLMNDRMKGLLEKVTPIFDWVVIDSPPAIPVHDPSILADLCDGVLFVVKAGSTDYEIAEKACGEFRDKNLLGVVLNRVDRNESYGSYYYGYPVGDDKEK
jgi:capsular exopolysaccharide synthesis family protein